MRNIGFGQILVLLLICFLLFGDLFSLKKKLIEIGKQVNNYLLKNNRKKGN
jgi:Sec-independent protein translocase protein TatA